MNKAGRAPMRVNFDAQIFSAQVHGGISRYITGLATALADMPGVEPRILAPFHCNTYLDAVPALLRQGQRSSATPRHGHRLASLLGSAWMQWRRPADILHQTYYYPAPHLPSRARTVLMVHDMIHEKFSDNYARNEPIARWKRAAVRRADTVLCNSESTRNDLLSHYPEVAQGRVLVTHLGIDDWTTANAQPTSDGPADAFQPPPWPYLLFVGNRQGYKNFAGLLEAYRTSHWLQTHVGLLCFGGGAFTVDEQEQLARLERPAHVQQVSGSDAQLARCYARAALFVYPSLYEGFGLPPLEAMGMDCPVACSNTSSIPEVVGDAGAYFDPSKSENIRSVLEQVLNASPWRDALVQRGRRRHAHFSWKRCAMVTLAAYRATLAA